MSVSSILVYFGFEAVGDFDGGFDGVFEAVGDFDGGFVGGFETVAGGFCTHGFVADGEAPGFAAALLIDFSGCFDLPIRLSFVNRAGF